MSDKQNNSDKLLLWLTLEASNTIIDRISKKDIPVFEHHEEKDKNTEDKCLKLIAEEACRIAEDEYNLSDFKGCRSSPAVRSWLYREQGKEPEVFKVLCKAVGEEDWKVLAERSSYDEIFSDKGKTFAHNGRQIKFKVRSKSILCPIVSAEIKGKNQNDKLETWQYHDDKPHTLIVQTNRWWWKGSINIEFKFLNRQQLVKRKCSVFVSKKGYVWAEIVYDIDTGKCEVK